MIRKETKMEDKDNVILINRRNYSESSENDGHLNRDAKN